MKRESMNQKDIRLYSANNIAPKYMMQKLTKLREK